MSNLKSNSLNLFATTPKGLELLLVDELRALGATDAAEKLAGVTFTGSLELAYKACLWSRLANRILLKIASFQAMTPEDLYAGVQAIQWDQHLSPKGTLAVNFTCTQSAITHTLFGAQKVKDAIVDQFRDRYGERPSVDKALPDVNVNVYLYRDLATVSIDLSGDSLHKRGYRLSAGAAPLKENLAAAILIRAGWPVIAKTGGMLIDPMCGSGTILIEGAMMAGDVAPGLSRDYFGFDGWKQHQPKIWEALLEDALAREVNGKKNLPSIVGYDADASVISHAFENIERAGFLGMIHVEKRDLSKFELKAGAMPGLLATNPPYGERLGEEEALQSLYTCLGDKLKQFCTDWKAAVFTGNPDLGKVMGLRAKKFYALFNGALPCKLLLFDVSPEKFIDRSPSTTNERRIQEAQKAVELRDTAHIAMFVNRLHKNIKHLQRWIEREQVSCYRLYDADLPEYAFAIDRYEQWIYVQEYPAPKTVDAEKALDRRLELLASLPAALDVPAANIFFRIAHRRTDHASIQLADCYPAQEAGAKFLINLRQESYETGLNLQQRSFRDLIRKASGRAHVLSLGDYAGVVSVCAALGSASSTKTVLETVPLCEWAERHFELNGIEGRKHAIVHSDLASYLERDKDRYHIIYADISSLEDVEWGVYQLLRLLQANGVLYVTSTDKQFEIPSDAFDEMTVEEITKQILPADFTREAKMQRFWKIN